MTPVRCSFKYSKYNGKNKKITTLENTTYPLPIFAIMNE